MRSIIAGLQTAADKNFLTGLFHLPGILFSVKEYINLRSKLFINKSETSQR